MSPLFLSSHPSLILSDPSPLSPSIAAAHLYSFLPSPSLTTWLDLKTQLFCHSLVTSLSLIAPFLLLCQFHKPFSVDHPYHFPTFFLCEGPWGWHRNSQSCGLGLTTHALWPQLGSQHSHPFTGPWSASFPPLILPAAILNLHHYTPTMATFLSADDQGFCFRQFGLL